MGELPSIITGGFPIYIIVATIGDLAAIARLFELDGRTAQWEGRLVTTM